ncbi:MAG: LPS export ABC transporter permease LptG [Planktomarina sp.]
MTLHLYFIRRLLIGFAATAAVFFALTFVIELMEHLRKLAGKDISFAQTLGLITLIAPKRLYEIMPLIAVIASVVVFSSMSRSSELVATRAAGRSGMRFLSAPILAMFVMGALIIGVINPLTSAAAKKYEQDMARYINPLASNAFAVSGNGIWLRQSDAAEDLIIHALKGSLDGRVLFEPSFWGYGPTGQSTRYIRAEKTTLTDGQWALENVQVWSFNNGRLIESPESLATLHIPTTLTVNQIQDSFGAPDSINFWKLPSFIRDLERTGFSALRHKVWYQTQLALPLFLTALTLIGAAMTIRPSRLQNNALAILGAIMIGIGFYFIRNFSTLLGENGQIGIISAAWVPPIAALGIALAIVLQREDG